MSSAAGGGDKPKDPRSELERMLSGLNAFNPISIAELGSVFLYLHHINPAGGERNVLEALFYRNLSEAEVENIWYWIKLAEDGEVLRLCALLYYKVARYNPSLAIKLLRDCITNKEVEGLVRELAKLPKGD